jgi:hypothetical protein
MGGRRRCGTRLIGGLWRQRKGGSPCRGFGTWNRKKTSSLPFHLLASFRAARAASCDNRLVTARIAGYQTPTRDERRVERRVLLSKPSKEFAVSDWTQSAAASTGRTPVPPDSIVRR